MANQDHQKNIEVYILFLLFSTCMLRNGVAFGNRISAGKFFHLGENNDIIECVDIYEQPAFNHPLLKNHTIQMKPSSYPSGFEARKLSSEIFQGWKNYYGKCPEGTIPIVRSQVPLPPKSMPPFAQYVSNNRHEYAQVSLNGGTYYGASAGFNVWRPAVESRSEFSIAQVWVIAGKGDGLNTMEAGWQVTGTDNVTRLFTYWTRDGYRSTGCYNLNCPGFVQTNNNLGLRTPLRPISTYGGTQYETIMTIRKDQRTKNWWLSVHGQDVGYWPSTIFTALSNSASEIIWGGEIVNSASGHHTSTKMGSGHFPGEGFGKASFISHIRYFDGTGNLRDPEKLRPLATNPKCYDVRIGRRNEKGSNIYYGGPGRSNQCP